MSLLDRGQELVLVYPEVVARDAYGNDVRGPGPTPVGVQAAVSYKTAAEDSSAGQQIETTVRVTARRLPGGPFARVSWGGRSWEVVGEVERRRSGSPAVHHDTMLLRALSAPEVPSG